MVSEWMHTLYGAIRVERVSPPVASRLLVYATTALYAGLAAADPRMPSVVGVLNGLAELPKPESPRRYDGALVAVAAERAVLDSLLREALPTTRAAFTRLADSLRLARIAAGIGEPARSQSEDLGRRIGLAIVAWSRTDGFDTTRGRPYMPPAGPGLWVNDAPASIYAAQNLSGATEFVALDNPANLLQAGSASDRGLILNRPKGKGVATLPPVNMAGASEPYWGQVRPFALKTWDECPVPAPPQYSTERGSAFHDDARKLLEIRSRLTNEQHSIALYWADNAGESGTPPGHWVAIASQMVSQRQLPTAEAARLIMLTAVAQADAFIASWGYKYRHNLIRPRTYIRAAIDSTWDPLIPTPPFPEYPSGHSTQSSAAAAVMTALIGDVPFDDSTSLSIGHPVRRYRSFRAAADEAGMSRVYAGIHYPFGNTGGRALGECVGAKVVERFNAARTP
jgi:membrane-associated phospholipid phosphatase